MVEEEDGQQRRWLRLRCDFVAWRWLQQGCGCNRGKMGQRSARLLQRRTAVVWRERPLLVVFTSMLARLLLAVIKEDGKIAAGSVMQREISAGSDQVAAGRDQGRWQREIAVAAMKPDGSERSLLVAFVPQGIAAGCDQGGWQREIAASSVVQREIRAAVEGIREVGWLKGW
ncbi:hypothetical protein GW17_00060258 [Ensete ventricosum]|nr:hypothetical protein GW17_00060258 [Ensete ventricosum]